MMAGKQTRRRRVVGCCQRGTKARRKRLASRCWHKDIAKDLARIDALLEAILADMGGLL